ncbi:Sulfate transport system permease protein CysW [Leclercia adecarboxylata]|uniref:ABC transporter permease n=3 Tax=Leclercia adecarboxylata TaxID=83655 RepID=A0A855EJX8_9ENTR|nr:iron ABC transporter permease [Leclercia adecarboxylata]KFC88907.1 permease component of an ABC superfamily ferric iron transporter [Leclercia adecarboxylata ATCC 23216 = NBRC 102595]PHH04263.1 ABC transporter permease [Leclercia adecarboxylata]UBH69133.1 iron ABC transporter permease [Leclercia adecarboxylata]SPX67450.1 Sulfate transport system permease protein CysW [Leclercia adecarboxylata]STX27031.1 Sulfate transport system permease protein CysW [Leclercia adecarboxylata]
MNPKFLSVMTLALLVILVAFPLAFILLQAVFPQFSAGVFSGALSGVATLLAEPHLPTMLGGTLQVGVGVALVSALIGFPLGVARGLLNLPLPRLWDLLFLIPFLTPPYIAALSWMLVLQTNGYLQQLTGFNLNDVLFSQTGIVLVMALNIFPVVYFAVSRSLLASGQRLALVARVHGASPGRAFWHITLPMLSPSLAAGMLLAFTLAIEEYGVPAALGTRAGVLMLTTDIEKKLAEWPIDLSGASMLSVVLVTLALSAWWLQKKLTGNQDVTSITGKPTENMGADAGSFTLPIVALLGLTGFVAVILPGASMALSGVLGTLSGGVSLANLTASHYAALFSQQGDALSALGTSLSLALGAACITGLLGLLAAWLVVVQKIKGHGLVDALSLMPAALPGVVVGVGLILLWNQPFWPVSPYNSWAILLLSYCCLLLPWPVRYVGSALRQLGGNLEPAARVHGASALQALRFIVLPLVSPAMLAAMLMVFAIASRELVTSLLLAPAGTQTVSVFIWWQFEQGSVGQGMAMATLTLLTGLVLMLTALGIMQRTTRG